MSLFTAWPMDAYRHADPRLAPAAPLTLDTARTLAWMAQLAYETETPAKLAQVLDAWGWEPLAVFAGAVPRLPLLPTAHGFVARHDGVRVVAFSGSDPMRIGDWVLDVMAHRTDDGAHAGFDAGVDTVWAALLEAIAGGGDVWLTGHSLGGALATVAALRLLREGLDVTGICTYGAPRTGDAAFAAALRAEGMGARLLRLVYGSDIVPTLPPPEAPFGYRHVGSSAHCRRGGRFGTIAADGPDDPGSGEGLLGRIAAALRPPPVADPLPGFPGDPAAAVVVDLLPAAVRDHLPDRYLLGLGLLDA